MSEIEKMYKIAGIKPDCTYLFLVDGNGENEAARTISIGSKADLKRLIVDCGVKGRVIKSTNTLKPFYPPFTTEKQLELIKFLQRKNGYKFSFSSTNDNSEYLFFAHKDNTPVQELIVAGDKYYEEALAGFINSLWQVLTLEEKQQVKGILE